MLVIPLKVGTRRMDVDIGRNEETIVDINETIIKKAYNASIALKFFLLLLNDDELLLRTTL